MNAKCRANSSVAAPPTHKNVPKGIGVAPGRGAPEHANRAVADAEHRRDEHHRQDPLPPQPRAQGREQLEVPAPEPLAAGEQVVAPVERPEHQVAGGGAQHRVRQHRPGVQPKRGAKPQPQERQGDLIRQQQGVEIDEREREQRHEQRVVDHRRRRVAPERHGHQRERPAGQLHERIARRHPRPAMAATAAQQQPAHHRQVVLRGHRALATRAPGAGHGQIETLGRRRRDRQRLQGLGAPADRQHDRQAMDDHVEETAERHADQRREHDRAPTVGEQNADDGSSQASLRQFYVARRRPPAVPANLTPRTPTPAETPAGTWRR